MLVMTSMRIVAGTRVAPTVRTGSWCHDGMPIIATLLRVVLKLRFGFLMSRRLVAVLMMAVMFVIVFHCGGRLRDDQ